MNKSETIGNLSAALSKLQGEIQDIYKDKSGYGYKYADLSGVLEVTRPLCAKYELAVIQLCTNLETSVGVETILTHSSGEWVSSTLYMPLGTNKNMSPAQAAGSVITYARRYCLAAILGVAQTDNDAAIEKPKEEEPKKLPGYDELVNIIKAKSITMEYLKPWFETFNVKKLSELKEEQIKEIMIALEVWGN